jgi:hypothetical protein
MEQSQWRRAAAVRWRRLGTGDMLFLCEDDGRRGTGEHARKKLHG